MALSEMNYVEGGGSIDIEYSTYTVVKNGTQDVSINNGIYCVYMNNTIYQLGYIENGVLSKQIEGSYSSVSYTNGTLTVGATNTDKTLNVYKID